MEPRARRQTLRLFLAEARSALDRGDRPAAQQAIAAALEVDPECRAAQALRDRIEQFRPDAPPPCVDAIPDAQPPALAGGGWARFEEHARLRRVEKRAAAARDAIAHRQFADARAAMDEIREIDTNNPELIPLQLELDSASRPPRRSGHAGPLTASIAAFCALLLGARYVETPRAAPGRPAPTVHAPLDPSAAAPAVSTAPQQVDLAVPSAVHGRTGEPAQPETSQALAPLPAQTEPAVSVPPPPIEPSLPPSRRPALESSVRPDLPALPPSRPSMIVWPPPQVGTDPGASGFQTVSQLAAPRPPVEIPSVATAAVPNAADPSTPPAAINPPSRPTAVAPQPAPVAPTVRDEDLVRRVLQQYRFAYEHLDAQAAQVVWPRVDSAALQRAFEGLASQRITFDDCDVQLRSGVGTAICRGSARYVPKVGSREPRIEPRVWTFGLRKIGDDWRIDTARATQ